MTKNRQSVYNSIKKALFILAFSVNPSPIIADFGHYSENFSGFTALVRIIALSLAFPDLFVVLSGATIGNLRKVFSDIKMDSVFRCFVNFIELGVFDFSGSYEVVCKPKFGRSSKDETPVVSK